MFWYIDVIESCCTKWGTWAGRRRRTGKKEGEDGRRRWKKKKEGEGEEGRRSRKKERGGNGHRREFMCCSVCVRMTDFSRVDIQCKGHSVKGSV